LASLSGVTPPLLAEAFAVWTGKGVSPMPKRNDERLIAHFGARVAQDLLPVIKSLEKDFYEAAQENISMDLNDMIEAASAAFRRMHPDISEDVVKILDWCCSYDWR
jgi:hypothetical protein